MKQHNTSAPHRVLVLGAGYAGANAAGRLARTMHGDDVAITVVNADQEFVERVRMHQLATGQQLKSRPLTAAFAGTGVVLREARVTAVDVDRRSVAITDEQGHHEIGYDTLIYALGSTIADHGVPGVREHAYEITGKQSATRLGKRLRELPAGSTVLIAGGGLTGIEAATEIAEARTDLTVALAVRAELGDWLGEKARTHLRKTFDRLGIIVHEHTDIVRIDETGALTGAGGRIDAETTVWTAGFAVHPIAAATSLEVAAGGRIVVDASMRSVSHPEVYAVGDAALAEGAGGRPLRMSCASGIPMAWAGADAIAARLTGREPETKPIGYTVQCVSLGRRDAIIQTVTPDDQAKPAALVGRSAARVKELICVGAAWSISHPTAMLPTRRRRIARAAR